MRKLLARLGGARREILRRSGASVGLHAWAGGVLLGFTVLAVTSGFYGARFVFGLSWPFVALVAVGWGVVVLTATRLALAGFRRGGGIPSRILSTLLRLVVVLLIGFVTAIPLTLAIFRPDIEARLTETRTSDAEASIEEADETIQARLRERVVLYEELTGGPNSAVTEDSQVVTAAKAYDEALKRYGNAEKDATCALVGSCGPVLPGWGPTYQQKQAAAEEARAALDQADRRLNDVSEAAAVRLGVPLDESARQELEQAHGELTEEEARRRTLVAGLGNDLLPQLRALGDIAAVNSGSRWLGLTSLGAFVLIGVLPVLLRLAAAVGPALVDDHLVEADRTAMVRTERAAVDPRVIAVLAAERRRIADAAVDDTADREPATPDAAPAERTDLVAPREPEPDRALWQAATDGVGGVFGLLGGTRVQHTELPPFEATLAADVDRLWQELAGTTHGGSR